MLPSSEPLFAPALAAPAGGAASTTTGAAGAASAGAALSGAGASLLEHDATSAVPTHSNSRLTISRGLNCMLVSLVEVCVPVERQRAIFLHSVAVDRVRRHRRELVAAPGVNVVSGEIAPLEAQSKPRAQVVDERHLVHAVTVREGVAVEKDVVRE